MSEKRCCDCEHFGLSKDPIFRVITGICGRCGKEVGYTDKCLFEEESFDKYLAERLNEKEEIIKEKETIINQLDQKIKDKNEYQQVLESKIRRLKDRIKVLEKNE